MKRQHLLLSVSPNSIALRVGRDDHRYLDFDTLGRIVSGRRQVTAVTFHHLADGKYGVSVDSIDPMYVFEPEELLKLIADHTSPNRIN